MDIFPAGATLGPISRILNGAIDGLTNTPSYLRKQAELNDFLGQVTGKYKKYCLDIYRHMRILAMAKPLELQQIYTEVRVLDQIQHRQSKTEKQIIEGILQGKEDSGDTLPALDITQSTARLVLLGRPGSGKSTFLKYFLLQQLSLEVGLDRIPILIPLNQLQQDQKTIFSGICGVLEHCGIEFASDLAEKLLETGKVRLLIDGLDEIRQTDRNQIIGEIDTLMKKYRDCGFVITCRSSAYEFWFTDCHHYEIEKFSEQSIGFFITRWFIEEPTKGEELVKLVTSNPRLRDLCSNPLMLTIVSIGFDAGIDVSNNRAEIYKDAIDALLKKWDASRSVYRDNLYKSLTPKRREDLLADLATRTFLENQVVFGERRAETIVQDFISTMPESADGEAIEDSKGVLNAIETQHGLIEKRSLSFWVFAHLTFQEYFVAQYMVARDPDLRARVVKQFIHRPDWREVIVLTGALLPNADDFVLQILTSVAEIGYGYGTEIKNEISEARRSVLHQKHDAEIVLSKAFDPAKAARRDKFEVIEGGLRLSLTELKEALYRFQSTTGSQINGVLFENIWGDKGPRGMSSYHSILSMVRLGHLEARYPENRRELLKARKYAEKLSTLGWQQCLYKKVMSRAYHSLPPELEDIRAGEVAKQMDLISKMKLIGQGAEEPSPSADDFWITPEESKILGADMFEGTLDNLLSQAEDALDLSSDILSEDGGFFAPSFRKTTGVLRKDNPDLGAKLNGIITSSNIFEVTNRRYIYLLPDNIHEFLTPIQRVVETINLDGIPECFRDQSEERLSDRKINALTKIIRQAFLDEVEFAVRKAAEENARNALKLRAFVAGETLAELLLSQVFLTPRVREAAVRSLKYLIGDFSSPDGSTPKKEVLRARV
ncbi:MAG TPA: NACHT domain-containing protein [Bradyrhizobium sp.]|jgi:hypothetical protein|nr:NACHT domain-containing protein [Bradyrhizobium sp.]